MTDLGTTPRRALTAADIDAARTPAGGWTREALAAWGVPWPPPKGWRKALIKKSQRRTMSNVIEFRPKKKADHPCEAVAELTLYADGSADVYKFYDEDRQVAFRKLQSALLRGVAFGNVIGETGDENDDPIATIVLFRGGRVTTLEAKDLDRSEASKKWLAERMADALELLTAKD